MAAVDDLRKSLGTSLDKICSDIKKMMGDSSDQKYEAEAIAIEKEEKWEREKEELTEKFGQLLREKEDRVEHAADDRHETVSTAITALQESLDNISTRMEKIEEYVEKQNNQMTIPQWVKEEEIETTTGQMDKNTILILGGSTHIGWFGNTVSDEMFLLNTERNGWIKLPLKLPKAFAAGGAVYLNEEIHIFGGRLGKELYKLSKKRLKWIRLADMNEGRQDITNSCLEWNGTIWIFGGGGRNTLNSVERYDPIEDKWSFMPYMKNARTHAAAAVWNGKAIVCGGWDGSNVMKSVECFDPESGVWTEMNHMPIPRTGHSLISYGNNLILMGGDGGMAKANTVLELSNLEGKGIWKELQSMKCSRSLFSVANLDNQLFVIGGRNGIFSYLDKTEIFDGEGWRDGPLLHYGCFSMSSVIGK